MEKHAAACHNSAKDASTAAHCSQLHLLLAHQCRHNTDLHAKSLEEKAGMLLRRQGILDSNFHGCKAQVTCMVAGLAGLELATFCALAWRDLQLGLHASTMLPHSLELLAEFPACKPSMA